MYVIHFLEKKHIENGTDGQGARQKSDTEKEFHQWNQINKDTISCVIYLVRN